MTTHQTFTLSQLQDNVLYTAELNGETVGVGTPEEFLGLLADGIFDLNDPIRFRVAV